MSRKFLGEFEELILTFVAILDQEAYGNRIVQEIKEKLDRKVNLSAVHITLYRLEDKGLISSEMGGATSKRGGRRKRFFRITSAGTELLYELQQQRITLWKYLPDLKFGMS